AQTLFAESDALEQTVRVNGKAFRVIGVMEEKGEDATDNAAYVPLSTALNRLLGARTSVNDGARIVDMIVVKAASSERIPATAAESAEILNALHQTADGTPDFKVTTFL